MKNVNSNSGFTVISEIILWLIYVNSLKSALSEKLYIIKGGCGFGRYLLIYQSMLIHCFTLINTDTSLLHETGNAMLILIERDVEIYIM